MSTTSRFRKFISNIQLTELQRQDAITKHTSVAEILAEYYYGNKSEVNGNKLLVGSYGKDTVIRPPSDVDVMFYLPVEVYNRINQLGWGTNKQNVLLQEVKKILERYYKDTTIRGDGQVVVVDFSSLKIEVVPAFRVSGGTTYIPNTHNGGSWKTIHPQNELQRMADSSKNSNGNTIRLIKMLKRWKRYCDVPIKSLILEVLSIEFMESYSFKDKDEGYYDFMIRDFLKKLVEWGAGNFTYKYPDTGEQVPLGNQWVSKAQTALNNAINACNFELGQNTDEIKATIEWKKIFGDDFEY